MPRREDIRSVFVVGSGPIVIGQACEFDYAGAQACKALKKEGLRVVLLNSNPATIMTDPEMADATYIEPITVETAERILAKERPDAMLATLGGQTGLNLAKELAERGILEKYGCELIGVNLDSIQRAEDRELFNQAMDEIGLELPKNGVAHSLEEAKAIVEETGFPAILRPSFTLGGTGGSIAYNKVEFEQKVKAALEASPVGSVLIDESVLGWKEIEVEVIRDHTDRILVVCIIENVDPMGIHTGDSISIAPALTLSEEDHARFREASEKIIRAIGVESGGCNIQFAQDPQTGRIVVIEMNPRVSRSSALASKATGYPIAKFSALLAIGYTLEEIEKEAIPGAPATREPELDFIVTKVPRFDFEKFPTTDPFLTTQMKSVGEAMAFGTTFNESFQKALRSLETGSHGLESPLGKKPSDSYSDEEKERIAKQVKLPIADRLYWVAEGFRAGMEVEELHALTTIHPYFLRAIRTIVEEEGRIAREGIQDAETLRSFKKQGFSDRRLALLTGTTEQEVRRLRRELGVRANYRRIRAYAGSAEGEAAYLYSTYADKPCDARPTEAKKVMILGGGPNRIGQGIEFDYCCVHASFALEEAGFETIMVNCNPETVSTDWETSDRLYFEPLTLEDVLELARVEEPMGAMVQFGGQTPLKLAQALEEAGIPILGTPPDAIDRAEDRERFTGVVQKLGLLQPENGLARSLDEALAVAKNIGFPVMVRPSYVLGGRAMEICHDEAQLREYLTQAVKASEERPVLVDRYLRDAHEVDIDVLCDGERVIVGGVLEHIEEAGVHSGDSACSLPPHSLPAHLIESLEQQTRALALALKVGGLMNVHQF